MLKDLIVKDIQITGANILAAHIDTNTPKGGDGGHGGVTNFEIIDEGGTDWCVNIDGKVIPYPKSIKIRFFGDSEAETFLHVIRFTLTSLRKQLKRNNGKN